MNSLPRKFISHLTQWVYSCHEIIVFRAEPLNGSKNLPSGTDLVQLLASNGVESLPPMKPRVERQLHQRTSLRSRKGDICVILLVDGYGVGFGWVRRARTHRVDEVGLPLIFESTEICFFDFFIDPDFRGRGLYTKFLREMRRLYGTCSAVIYAESSNIASLAGICSAGFTPIFSVTGASLFRKQYLTSIRPLPPSWRHREC